MASEIINQEVWIAIRFSLISLNSSRARLCLASFFENKAIKKLASHYTSSNPFRVSIFASIQD